MPSMYIGSKSGPYISHSCQSVYTYRLHIHAVHMPCQLIYLYRKEIHGVHIPLILIRTYMSAPGPCHTYAIYANPYMSAPNPCRHMPCLPIRFRHKSMSVCNFHPKLAPLPCFLHNCIHINMLPDGNKSSGHLVSRTVPNRYR